MGVDLFQCPVCKLAFASKNNQRRHVEGHYQQTKYKCHYCSTSTARMDNWKRHMRKCKFNSSSPAVAPGDIDSVSASYSVRCMTGIKQEVSELAAGQASCHGNNSSCTVQDAQDQHVKTDNEKQGPHLYDTDSGRQNGNAGNKADLQTNVKPLVNSKKRSTVFHCPICNVAFASKKSYRRHIDSQYQTAKYRCHYCSTSMTSDANWKRGMCKCKFKPSGPAVAPDAIDSVSVSYSKPCIGGGKQDILEMATGRATCQQIINHSSTVQQAQGQHVETDHGKQGPHSCDTDSGYRDGNVGAEAVRQTMGPSHNVKPLDTSRKKSTVFQCPVCKVSFASKYNRRRHMKKHYQKTKYQCHYCSTSTARRDNWKRHMRKCKLKPAGVGPDDTGRVSVMYSKRCIDRGKQDVAGLASCHRNKPSNTVQDAKNQHANTDSRKQRPDLFEEHGRNDGNAGDEADMTTKDSVRDNKPLEKSRQRSTHMFTCDHCFRMFQDFSSLHSHIHTHTDVDVFECKVCKASFISEIRLQRHTERQHPTTVYKCDFCEATFKKKGYRKRHMNKCSFKGLLSARKDLSVFDLDSSGVLHTRKGEGFTCDHCFRKFLNLSSLKRHIYTHVDVEVFDCLECNAFFLSKRGLRRHINRHRQERHRTVYKCDFCQADVIKGNMTRHLRRCKCKPKDVLSRGTDDLGNGADSRKVEATFQDERPADIESRKNAGTGLKRFPCTLCDVTFVKKSRLKRHTEEVHEKKKTLLCHICGKLLFLSTKLSYHILLKHSENSRIPCDICGKKYSPASLRAHKLMHVGKPYQCTICRKTFSQRGGLIVHRRTHTGERPFECKTCGKTFKVKHGLHQHQLNHTGPRETFECKVCNKSFRHSGNLYTHMAIHKAIKSHRCDLCGMSFRLPHHLRNHLKTHERKRRR